MSNPNMGPAGGKTLRVQGPACELAVHLRGDPAGEPVVMTHSILCSSMMWADQAAALAERGWRVILVDARGHGASGVPSGPATMDDLADDTVAVLDALGIARAHYVGLSLGGMSGFGLALRHPERLSSALLCDARVDTPGDLGKVWDERIAIAQSQGTAALADSTVERWFGRAFVERHPNIAARFRDQAAATSVAGFVSCAQAIQSMNYLPDVARIAVPVTLLVGGTDGVLPDAMRDLQRLIAGAVLEVIPDAGHLPNIDQPAAFQDAFWRHFSRVATH